METFTERTQLVIDMRKTNAAITDEDAQELVSLCLIGLHSALGRLNISKSKFDRQSVDMQLDFVNDRPRKNDFSSSSLRLQAKAITNPEYSADGLFLIYDLKVKNYNDLRKRHTDRRLLAIAVLDGNVDNCLVYGNEFNVKAKVLYFDLKGFPSVKNTSTVRIRVPVSNIFDHKFAVQCLTDSSRRVWKP